MAHAVAGGLVLDLVLAEGACLDHRDRLTVTGHQPSDAVLAGAVEAVAEQRRPPRVDRFTRQLAAPEGGGWTVEPWLVALARAWPWRRRVQRGSSPLSEVRERAARRTADEAEAAHRPVREVLVGGREPGEVDADVLALAGLSLLGNLVRGLVALDDLDLARERAAAFGGGPPAAAEHPEPAGRALGAVLPEVIQAAPVTLGLPIRALPGSH